ncbi:hypothetical protein COM04_16195 [Bacillus wiedmannii]|nr:hypothetical protein DN394_08700 [Bacillus sp. BB081]PEP76519.1 hypothetical protein CN573_07490 [Bacillus wiedmannii]TXR62781.1 hypothetical protein DM800_19100 [Bacillus sp. AY18-3]PGB94707.1 hypothetical protein COM04_16195 [Bacillus wiedmannii]PGC20516.1 hypothetical protein COM23_24885 [Bacillus wiedmannii]
MAFVVLSQSSLALLKIYQRFFKYIYHNSQYINDFFNISTIRHRISTYRQKSTQHAPIKSYTQYSITSKIAL